MKGYLISGDDDYEIKQRANTVVNDIVSRNPDIEVDIIDAGNPDADPVALVQDFINAVCIDSLFGSDKLVWFKHCTFFGATATDAPKRGKKGKAVKADLLDPITELFNDDGVPATMTILIDGPGIDRRKSFYKTCEAKGLTVDWYAKPDPADRQYAAMIHNRIEALLNEAGVTADNAAMECLKGMLGGDSARIRSEIDKLICYVGDTKRVTVKDCMTICSHTPEALNWALTDALKSKDIARALDAISELIEQMESETSSGYEMRLLAGVSNEFQNLVKVREALDELSLDPAKVHAGTFQKLASKKEEFPHNILLGMHPFRAFKMAETLAGFSDEALVKIIHEILATNKALVSGADNNRICLEQLAYKICRM